MREENKIDYSYAIFNKYKNKEYGMNSSFDEEYILDLEVELILSEMGKKIKTALANNLE